MRNMIVVCCVVILLSNVGWCGEESKLGEIIDAVRELNEIIKTDLKDLGNYEVCGVNMKTIVFWKLLKTEIGGIVFCLLSGCFFVSGWILFRHYVIKDGYKFKTTDGLSVTILLFCIWSVVWIICWLVGFSQTFF